MDSWMNTILGDMLTNFGLEKYDVEPINHIPDDENDSFHASLPTLSSF
jgi:hypothetical protein